MAESAQGSFRRGLVKQVISGDAIVLQGPAQGGPPPETTVYLSNVTAPRLGKRPTETTPATPDEPYAWESREFLRKKLVGQVVTFVKDYTATSGRDHGRIYLGGTNPENAENVTETAVAEGLLEVRQSKIPDEYSIKLNELQDQAKVSGKGKWSPNPKPVREVKWVIDNPRALVDQYKQKPVDAVVEMVRDGSTFRVLLLPNFEYITLQLSGVRAPVTRSGADGKTEPFSEEAKHFAETRLLQQDLQSVSNQNIVGSVVHPRGNIAESLLREGFAKCVDWSIGLCTGGAEKLRTAERQAKEKRVRLWRSYTSPTGGLSADKKAFSAKVVEIVMSDAMIVQKDDGTDQKIFLSSVRLPRGDGDDKPAVGRQFRPLYDIPFMFQAREFLRKRLVGKKANITVDYIQPKSEQYPEKICCTIRVGDANIAEGLISRGLSKVVRHRADDENRSSEYDALLAAEANAEKSKKGLFADKSVDKKDTLRIQELQGDLARSKQFLPYLQRSARSEGVVEFISSGSRMRVYIPKETCIITFLLSGISVPKTARSGPGGVTGTDEPFANEATSFTRNLTLQREVEIEVEGIDKMGNFVGYLFVSTDGGRPLNLSELLLEQGLASVHFTAEKSGHYNALLAAEQRAKNARRNIWANYKEEAQVEETVEPQNDTSERKVNMKKIVVSDIARNNFTLEADKPRHLSFKFSAQHVEDGAKLEKLMADLRENLTQNKPMTGAYVPRKGDLCVAPFSADGQWYRARVDAVRSGQSEVTFIDYGNKESVASNALAQLPAGFANHPGFSKEYALALTQVPFDKEYGRQAEDAFEYYITSTPIIDINVEYKAGSLEYVQAFIENQGKKTDLGLTLVQEGYALADKRREARLQDLVSQYQDAEKKARRERRVIWEFGDFTGFDL